MLWMLWIGALLAVIPLIGAAALRQRRRASGDLFQLDVAHVALAVVFMSGCLMAAMSLLIRPLAL